MKYPGKNAGRCIVLFAAMLAFMPDARAGSFTAAQRAEIVSILRDALRSDPTILRDAVVAMQADEGARERAVTQAALEAVRDQLVTADDPVGGNPKGDVTIVEFFDTRCGYCRRLEPVMARFLAKDRNVRLVYKDLPILGPASVLGSKALIAAAKQSGYEKLRDALMKLPPDTTLPMIEAEARTLGLDWPRLARDMEDPAVRSRIDANLKLASALNIQGTPAMVIGGELVPGAVEFDELARVVAEARRTAR